MPEERKLATILFADIVGSTALGEAADPELVRRTLARAFAQMRESLALHGGTVEKFVGDAVMAVFGVPQAHDDDADRAIRAAFALRDLVAALSPSLPFPLALRIGVSTGQVVAGVDGADTLVTGSVTNAAARLQQSATPGEIVVGSLTRQITQGGVRYGAARQIEAKGFGVIEAYRVESLLSALPEQHRGLGRLRAPLIGRESELRLLREAFQKASEERTAYLMTVFGQAGVGKSRLIRELVEIIGRERVLRGRCLPYGSGITYWPLQEILRSEAGINGDDTRDDAARKIRAAVLTALGPDSEEAEAVARRVAVVLGTATVGEALPDIASEDLGREVRWAVRRYFERRASQLPLALIVDDIHWAEEPMLQMIEHLAEWSRAPLYILCLARPELRDKRPGWGGGLMNAGAIRLEPLNDDEARRLIAALLAVEDLPESVRDSVVSRAQGNPLYVEEILRMLIDSGHITERDGRWVAGQEVADVSVPSTLQGLLTARLDQLPAPIKRALQRAAVVGKVFYEDAITALGPLEGRADELLTSAAWRDFVIERDERGPGGGRAWQFKHILIRDVAYESIPKEERSRMHDAVGRWLETSVGERGDEYAEIVAYHADLAYRLARELHDERSGQLGRRALDLVLPAARRARRGGDLRSARALYERAGDISEKIDATIEERAESLGFGALMAEPIEGRRKVRDRIAAALAVARLAGPSEVLIELLYSEGEWYVEDDPDRSRALLDEAVATARQQHDPAVMVAALVGASELPFYLGDMSRHLALVHEARAVIEESGQRHLLERCLRPLVKNAMDQGDFETFVRAENERIDLARLDESKFVREFVPQHARYGLALLASDYDGAINAARRVVAINAEFGYVGGWQDVGLALAAAGRHREAIEQYSEAIRVHKERTTAGTFGEARQKLARAQLACGDLEAARVSAELAYREIYPHDAYSRTTAATALAMVRDAEGSFAEADRLHREALAVNEHTGNQLTENEARVEYARFLLRQGRAREARPLLEKVRDFFAHPFVVKRRQEAEELLRRCDEVRAT
jgi:class 3 adenylate cyclase/tetratricopeptide (TPR) repeat protein